MGDCWTVTKKKNEKLSSKAKVVQNALHLAGHRNRIWCFTSRKSGTTYFLNVLANYMHILTTKRHDPAPYKSLACFHSFGERILTGKAWKVLEEQRELIEPVLGYEAIIHTHDAIPHPNFGKIVCITRNPLDVSVSSYFYHVVNRGVNKSFDEVLEARLEAFSKSYLAQRKVASKENQQSRWIVSPRRSLKIYHISQGAFEKLSAVIKLGDER